METVRLLGQKKGGDLVTYSAKGKHTWKCNEGHIFMMTLNRVRKGKWCQTCGSSIGERKLREFFRAYQIPFISQAILPAIPTRRYDYYFEWRGRRCLVEFDGEQHFRFVLKYHRTKSGFLQSQAIDRVKTYVGLLYGYQVIRIDYSQRDAIGWHIANALQLPCPLYVSSPDVYSHLILISITYEEIRKYAPSLF